MVQDTLEIYVFRGHDGSFELYEDDGLSLGYQRGECARISLAWDEANSTLTIGECRGAYPGMPEVRHLTIHRVRPGVAPMTPTNGLSVTYDGSAISVVCR